MNNDIQEQFTLERQNEAFYRALSAAADVVNYPGAAAFFAKAADDEQSHAKRMQDYLVDRGRTPIFEPIEAIPPIDGNDYVGMFRLALQRENITTASLQEKAMRADDDGFLNNPKKVQRMVNASDDDLRVLCSKSFIIPFESGVIVIKHWRMSNYLRVDRYKPTVYKEEFAQLSIKENN